ncbi:MAG TPA: succinylglutamate desuccinylase/aspartoacylase family protein [Mesotoga sp.]|nr:succinylglutamate desuccinylase/aspartoacylase family protein [Mesotoga sp.]NLX34689.1 deacylase [Thermotogaceae bacterium]MDD4039694.1 succinylglutamate desuccinylase/aspartoacylase family protein [Mesotoga sp.]MDD4478391.1 succinylglutamate desuccinylase/aspartoacylase family protein [Mesotoga sp.]MDD5744167.1 succinylglutamate desuccinylase/aspartoacylase family protein [Mesotoga sp.]
MKKLLVILLILMGTSLSLAVFFRPDIRPGYGVTETKWLSYYFEPLEGTNMDTVVYFMDSGKAGPTFLLMGGTHAMEIAGTVAATIFIENAIVERGRVIVIPFSNSSGASIATVFYPNQPDHFLQIQSKSGPRFLVYGDRNTDVNDQGRPDPEVYLHYPSGQELPGYESRNLNRNYPGRPDGTPTEKLAFAIMELIKKENVDFNLDMHESDTPDNYDIVNGVKVPGGRLAYMLVCHQRGMEIGALATMEIEFNYGVSLKLEESNIQFRGLSHREIGDATGSISFLVESPNPGFDFIWREKPDTLYDEKYPLKHRVGMHLATVEALVNSYNMMFGTDLAYSNIPNYNDLMQKGFEAYLN